MLLAAEIGIVGMAIYVVGGRPSFASGTHQVDFTSEPIAPVAAGSAPHVVIDDADSRVRVGPSSDGFVHVRDLTQFRGAFFSSEPYPRLTVTRTPDGVRIVRPHAERLSVGIFGFSVQRIEIDAPQGSRVEISRCAGADVAGISGGVSVNSVDGHVTLSGLQGTVDAHSDDGSISATDVRADRLAVSSGDGHLSFDNVVVASLDGTTRDGSINAGGLRVSNDATLQTNDGSIRVSLAPSSDLTVDASTRDGRISVDGNSIDGDDSAQRTIRVGTGTGHLAVATDDGSIRIYTNGELQSNG
jgi:hypothetical protein